MMSGAQRIAEIREAWEYDMTHPYRANQKLDGKGYVAQWIDGHTESRSREECDRSPFNVRANHSDLSSIGFLLAQLDQSQREIERLRGVLEIANDCLFGNTYGDRVLEEAYQVISLALNDDVVKCDECGVVLDKQKGEDFFVEPPHGRSLILCEKDWKAWDSARQALQGGESHG